MEVDNIHVIYRKEVLPDLDKVQQLLSKVPAVTLNSNRSSFEDNEEEFIEIGDEEDESNHAKKRRINDDSDKVWLKVNECILKIDDYDKLSGGLELVNNHIHAAQSLLNINFLKSMGLDTLWHLIMEIQFL